MDAPHTAPRSNRRWIAGVSMRARAAALAGALAVALALAVPTAAPAASQSAVDAATASPPRFVPDWDGHTDVTVLSYRLLQQSSVTVRVLDARGRIVTSQRVGVRDAGVHEATWDGRRANGALVPPGQYRLRVDAQPVRVANGEPDSASLGGTPVRPGARATTVTVQRPAVTLTSVQLTRTSIGRARSSLRAGARFRLSTAASVSAAIVDARGRVVRSLKSGRARAGATSVNWDGRTRRGAWAADGDYALVVAATGGGRPTTTQRLPITVDRVIPVLRMGRTANAGIVSGSAVRIPLLVRASEPGTVLVRFGRRTWRTAVPAGATRIAIDGHQLGLVAGKLGRTVSVTVLLRDGAGNTRGRRVRVAIPARATVTAPPPPATTDPGTSTPPPAGKWPWPVDGIVTSEFGLRDGRPHEGIDIAVPTGTPIHPVAPGTVSFVGSYGGYGNLVIVDHGGEFTTRYAHLSRFGDFAVGATVTHTDVIGLVGCTGSCTGPHVHFETRSADTARNPRAFLVAR